MQVVVDQLLINYQRLGKAKDKQVLILHGWGESSTVWQTFAAELAKNYDVLIPDLPGFGASQPPSKPWGLDQYARFIAAFIEKLELDLYLIIGHSNGGAIAIRGLGRNIFTAERLVLLASAGIRGEFKGRNKALRVVAKTGKLLAAPLPKATKKKLRHKVYKSIGSDLLVVESLQETFKKVVGDDVRADATNITVPTLLLYGELDEQTPLRYGELYHELINMATLAVIPDAGHFLYRTHQPEVIKIIREFMAA